MRIGIFFLFAALTAGVQAQLPELKNILAEANSRQLVLVVAEPKGTTAIPVEDQVPAEEDDPGAAVPS